MISGDTSLYYSESLEQANALYVLYGVVPLDRVSLSPVTLIFSRALHLRGALSLLSESLDNIA